MNFIITWRTRTLHYYIKDNYRSMCNRRWRNEERNK